MDTSAAALAAEREAIAAAARAEQEASEAAARAIAFTVKHESFEGPIEVLLELIEKRKLFVSDVSLATVTDDFIAYIQHTGMHPDTVAHFLVVAATLILIKARSLLPTLDLTEEETESISDLERRVALYQVISQVSAELIAGYGKCTTFSGAARPQAPVFAPDQSLSAGMLPTLIVDIIGRIPPPQEKKPQARVYKTISLTEVLSTLTDRIEKALGKMQFSALRISSPDGDSHSEKVYTIISFLGMLELVRRGVLMAEQPDAFADISLEKHSGTHTDASAAEHVSTSYEE